jgi:hypothetical protein
MKHLTSLRILLILPALFLSAGLMLPVSAEGDSTVTPTPTPTVINQPALGITAVQPNTISNVADTEIVVTGSGFVEGASVILGGSGSLPTTFVSANLLRAIVLTGTAPNVYSLTVINPNAASATLPNALIVTAPAGPTNTPWPTNTPAPTAFVRPLLVVSSYGASSAEIVPNSDLDFEMTIANSGAIRATNIVATFVSGDFVARATGGVRSLGTLDPGQVNRFWQPLHAGDVPSGGIATLQVKVDYTDVNGTTYTDTFALTFPVRRAPSGGAAPTATPTVTPSPTPTATIGPRLRPQLIVTAYETTIEQLEPGMHFTLSLTVQNQGNADAERITMIVGGGTASGGDANGTPTAGGGVSGAGGEFSKFAPVGTSNIQTLGSLAVGSNLNATMAFIVNAATEPGAYPVKVSFVYEDAQNSDFVDDQVITLLVVKRPSVQMNFFAPPPPFFVGEPGSLSLQIINTGSKTAVLGAFTVSAADAIIENGTVFVGNLEPGGFYPLDALIIPNIEGSQELQLSINYTDDFGQPQTITQTATIEVLPPFIFEEPVEEPIDAGPPSEPEPETPLQTLWRFILGLLGLSSGRPQPDTNSEIPVEGIPPFDGGGGEGVPIEGPILP